MKKKIIALVLVWTVCFTFGLSKVKADVTLAYPKIDFNEYEEYDDFDPCEWNVTGEAQDGVLVESEFVPIRANDTYFIPLSHNRMSCIDFTLKTYDTDYQELNSYTSSVPGNNREDFVWVITDTTEKNTVGILYSGDNSIKYMRMFFTYRTQEIEEAFEEICANCHMYVRKLDEEAPVLNGTGVYITNVDHPILLSTIQSALTAIDNVDGNISDNIHVIEDGYTGKEATVGVYTIIFGVEDSSNNESTYTVIVHVYDIEGPVITSKEYNVLAPMGSGKRTVEQIKALLSASDNVDGDVTNSLVCTYDNYTENQDKEGTYRMIFSVSDKQGNISECTIYITVSDDVPPMILVEGTIIPTDVFSSLNFEDIKALLKQYMNLNDQEASALSIEENEYEGNEEKPGLYNMTVSYVDETGITRKVKLQVLVYDNTVKADVKTSAHKSYVWPYITIASVLLVSISLGAYFILHKKSI